MRYDLFKVIMETLLLRCDVTSGIVQTCPSTKHSTNGTFDAISSFTCIHQTTWASPALTRPSVLIKLAFSDPNHHESKQPIPPPLTRRPPSSRTVSVSIIDTTDTIRGIPTTSFLDPHIKGHDYLAAPASPFSSSAIPPHLTAPSSSALASAKTGRTSRPLSSPTSPP